MNPFSEANLIEQTTLDILKKIWEDPDCHTNAFSDMADLSLARSSRSDVLLPVSLKLALEKLNPTLPAEAISDAIAELARDRSNMTVIGANQEIHKLIKDGINVEVRQPDGSVSTETVRLIDFNTPQNNHFQLVSQLWIVGQIYTKRPDIILYVNGIPLVLFELKAAHKNLSDAIHSNITPYVESIPKLFWYNMAVVISNGIENKVGAFNAPFEYYNDWKKVTGDETDARTDLRTLLSGFCDKTRLLDILENYILYDTSKGKIKKIVPRYFQYYGVNQAFENVQNRKQLEGRLGVFWHTQGSGKSYSMVYLSQKVMRKLHGNFTFVIVTDRKDLDGQAYGNFAGVGAVYEKEVRATSIQNLHELLQADHRQIFTTIQKFQDIDEAISERSDIIVMTDEAHRSQYDHFALNMRKALPNASFIGFTGTPLMAKGEEKTRETFGDYVSVYNFGQSVADKATVPLFYENRVPELKNINDNLEQDLERVMEFYDLNVEEEEKLESEFSTFYHLVTREDRLNAIARDIVQHFVSRGYDGKAMVVCVDKKTAVRMHHKVQNEWDRYLAKLRLDLSRTIDDLDRTRIQEKLEQHEDVDMAVVVSQSQSEIEDMAEFEIDMRPIRERMQTEDLEERFKKEDSTLRIVFVCAMWLTGFDVPNLSTLYLDKPLQNHTLMQTIARANRVYPGKQNGVIVDYIGIFKNIKRALAMYAASGLDAEQIIRDKQELVRSLIVKVGEVDSFLKEQQVDIAALLDAESEQKITLIETYVDHILASEEVKRKFLGLSSDLNALYKSALPEPEVEVYQDFVTAITALASRVRDVGNQSIDLRHIKRDLEELLDRSIQAGEYIIPQHKKIKDLSQLDADGLRSFFFELDNKHIQLEQMKAELQDRIADMVNQNRTRLRFMERFASLIEEYNSGAHDLDQLFEDLVQLAKDLDVEEQRAVKESLSEDELAIFDLLVKDQLTPAETERVKHTAKTLLSKLQNEKLVLDWRERESTRAGVKSTIFDIVYGYLPEPTYTEAECEFKGVEVYNFVYERYR